jgi:hypothetical protein
MKLICAFILTICLLGGVAAQDGKHGLLFFDYRSGCR